MKATLILLAITILSFNLNGQDHFLVELEERTPDVKDLVQSYEGFSSIPFMAADMTGKQQSLLDYRGKNVILWFWNTECVACENQLDELNLLQQKYGKELQILSLIDESKADATPFVNTKAIDFPVIPNSKTLADGPYSGDMGYPRIFILDDKGVIRWVFPEKAMEADFKTYRVLETLIVQLINE